MSGFFLALLRALPFALCLPLPGLFARFALGLLLAAVSLGHGVTASPLHELGLGTALACMVAMPVWAAMYAGRMIDAQSAARGTQFELVLGSLAWIVFGATGGLESVFSAYLQSYSELPALRLDALQKTGLQFLLLSVRIAGPAVLALAVSECAATLLSRFEESAQLPMGSRQLALAARPLLASVLLLASFAAFAHAIGSATENVWR